METIRLTSTASQGDVGCSCTYPNRSTTPCCSQHLSLHTNQAKSGPSSPAEALGLQAKLRSRSVAHQLVQEDPAQRPHLLHLP